MKIITTFIHLFFSLLTISLLVLATVLLVTTRKMPLWGIHSYSVLSGSMTPKYPIGTVLFTIGSPVYELGDVIAFKRRNEVITHRVISYSSHDGQRSYLVKGDANNVADSDRVDGGSVIGKVFFSIPYIGRVLALLHQPLGVLTLIGIPALLLILHEVWVIKNEFEIIIEKKVRKKLQREVQDAIRSYISASQTTGG